MKKSLMGLMAFAVLAAVSTASFARAIPARVADGIGAAKTAVGEVLAQYVADMGLVLGVNIFTALQPTLFSAAQEVSAEPFGVISAITSNFDDKGVAVGDLVTVPVAPIRAVKSFTPAMAMPTGDDATANAVQVQITNTDYVDWNMTGEQLLSLQNAASDKDWVRQMIAQGMRALRNKAELAACNAIKVGASRAVGTAGTNPFASDINIIADVRKVLFDNGAPMADLQLCIDSSAGTSARKLGIVQQAYQAGDDTERRTGDLLRQFGFAIRESAGIVQHVKGSGANYVTSGATAAGVQSIALVTGTGTVLAGDVAAFAADSTNKYVVGEGVAAPGTIKLNRPGARQVIPTANAMTLANSYTPNLAFERSSVVGIMRAPIIPANPIITQTLISDKFGMTYLLLQIAGYGMTTWQLHIAYGFKVVQSEHVALVLG